MFEQETYERKPYDEKVFEEESIKQKFATRPLTQKSERGAVVRPKSLAPEEPKQRQLMLAALALLMVALCFALYRDRDFWFPDAQEAELDEPAETTPAAAAPAMTQPAPALSAPALSDPLTSSSLSAPVATSKPHTAAGHANTHLYARQSVASSVAPAADSNLPPAVVSNRTALPPLNVEVVAGDNHRTIRPGTNSIRVDLQPGAAPQSSVQPATEIPTVPAPATAAPETATADVTSTAAERVQMSADTEEVVRNPVKPGYPLLARQMKVQGSVILRALISKDGTIQDLHVLSGPHILAAAAEDAVRQWHFKPHFIDDEAVETQAKITVNFTISTN